MIVGIYGYTGRRRRRHMRPSRPPPLLLSQSINRSQQRHVRGLCLQPEEDWGCGDRRGEKQRERERGDLQLYEGIVTSRGTCVCARV